MSRRVTRTVVLTSRENFVWLSMQEIIPLIERNWEASRRPGAHEVVCRDVDQLTISELMPELVKADNIVFSCFTVKLARLGELLRKTFALEARYFIYLHNQATILCWPLHVWGIGQQLREDDVFISTSTADARTFRHSFKKGRVEIVPFTIPQLRSSYPGLRPARSEIPFVYAGRLSAQKNLHTLLYSFRLLSDAEPALPWRLSIYGKDDDLGSPNMGMSSRGYGRSLRRLVRELGLEERVSFRGYLERSQLNRILSETSHINVSASLHSDENFGMAQFRSIVMGNPAVLTRWGGYADFGKKFPDRVLLVPVEKTELGPWVDPARLARVLAAAAKRYACSKPKAVHVPDYYREDRISARLLALARKSAKPGRPLRMTALAGEILRRRDTFKASPAEESRIFESYADPCAQVAFSGYRMAKSARPFRKDSALRCLPWVKLAPRSIQVEDPHRGSFKVTLHPGKRSGTPVFLTDGFGKKRRISREAATQLASMGYLHAQDPGRRR